MTDNSYLILATRKGHAASDRKLLRSNTSSDAAMTSGWGAPVTSIFDCLERYPYQGFTYRVTLIKVCFEDDIFLEFTKQLS